MTDERPTTYLRCTACGFTDDSVCGVMFGHKCRECGAVDAGKIERRRRSGAATTEGNQQ